MAKKKKEKPTVDNEVGELKIKEKKEQQPTGNETKGNITKVKAKMKQPAIDLDKETITKIDLSKPPKPVEENEVKEDNTNNEGMAPKSEDANTPKEQKEVQSETETQETPILEEITIDGGKEEVAIEATTEAVEEAITESIETGKPLPESVKKLMDFMEDTGGDLNDYVKLNQNYSDMDNQDLIFEYYKQTKPHLDNEEINFIMEDQFGFDDDTDEIEVKRKKLALKEQVASAKSHLDGQKSKYYKEIKAGSKLTQEQQKAMDFFNRYQKQEEETQKRQSIFENKTNQVFSDKFKGFEYNIGDKNYRFNVSDADKVKDSQSDLTNFVGKFLDKDNNISDAKGYHKSLFTAMNADAVAKHFYEQGKADAMKDSVAKAKNVNMDPRQSHGVVEAGGIKVKVLGEDSSDFKFKIKNKNK